MTNKEIKDEIQKDINSVIGETVFYKSDNINIHLQTILQLIFLKYQNKINSYRITTEYPYVNVIIIHCDGEKDEIPILKFERLSKITKLNKLNGEENHRGEI